MLSHEESQLHRDTDVQFLCVSLLPMAAGTYGHLRYRASEAQKQLQVYAVLGLHY